MAVKKKTANSPTTWTYNGHEFELDMDHIDTLAIYDEAVTAMKAAFRELPPGASDAYQLIAYCNGIRRMLDVLFGDGTADKLLGDTKKPTDHDDVYESLTDFVHEQTAASAQRRANIINKYKPKPNREQRRVLEKLAENIGQGE